MIPLLKIRRGNTVLRIENDTLDYYMTQGFDLVDESGKVIKKAIPTSKEDLHKAYIENVETIKRLETKISELEKQLEELKKVPKPTVNKKTTSRKK